MDGFDDAFGGNGAEGQQNGSGGGVEGGDDPAAEFLAREQNNLAGLEDDIPPAAVVTNGISSDRGVSPTPSQEAQRPRSVSPASNRDGGYGSEPREDPEKIRIWREEQKKRLEVKDLEEEGKKDELKEAAAKELEEWYKSHEEQIVNNRKANRSAEKELVADTDPMEPGTEWERIAKLCDFNPKGSKHSKDISRMRSIILQLKQAPPLKRE